MNLDRSGGAYRLGHVLHQQVGQDTGIDVTRPQDDSVSPFNRLQHRRIHISLGVKPDIVNAHVQVVPAQVNNRFPEKFLAVFQPGHQGRMGKGNRQHLASNPQHLGRLFNGGDGVSGDLGEGGQQQVAKVMAVQAVAGTEAVVEEAAHQVALGIFRSQGHQALPDVPRRQLAQLLPQPPGTTPAVGHCYDSGQVAVLVP